MFPLWGLYNFIFTVFNILYVKKNMLKIYTHTHTHIYETTFSWNYHGFSSGKLFRDKVIASYQLSTGQCRWKGCGEENMQGRLNEWHKQFKKCVYEKIQPYPSPVWLKSCKDSVEDCKSTGEFLIPRWKKTNNEIKSKESPSYQKVIFLPERLIHAQHVEGRSNYA